jgi:hypothetical protein
MFNGLAMVSLAIALLAVAAWVLSVYHPYDWYDNRHWWDNRASYTIHRELWTQRGEILFEQTNSTGPPYNELLTGPDDWPGIRGLGSNDFAPISGEAGLLRKLGFDHWFWPRADVSNVGWAIPDWSIVALGLLLPMVRFPGWIAFIKKRREARVGTCAKCGYNLTANVSGVCPECGKPIENVVQAK